MKITSVHPGDRYGKLVVIENAPIKRGYCRWLCRCDCGKIKAVTSVALVSGNSKSCGCSRYECKIIKSGDKHGRLTAIAFVEKKGCRRTPIWKFKCDCGAEVTKNAFAVVNGNTSSCGCLRSEKASSRKGIPRPNSDQGARSLFSRYKCRALDRRKEFTITYEQFKELAVEPCKYCGKLRTLSPNVSNQNRRLSGLDRVDSKAGYSAENCVPCCTKCNVAKSNMSTEEFKEWVKEVYQHLHEA